MAATGSFPCHNRGATRDKRLNNLFHLASPARCPADLGCSLAQLLQLRGGGGTPPGARCVRYGRGLEGKQKTPTERFSQGRSHRTHLLRARPGQGAGRATARSRTRKSRSARPPPLPPARHGTGGGETQRPEQTQPRALGASQSQRPGVRWGSAVGSASAGGK